MAPTLDLSAAALAARQAGSIARWQLLPLGITDRVIRRRLTNSLWRRAHPGVYVLASAPITWLQAVWSALLAAGPKARVTHETALLTQGASDDQLVPRYPLTLTAPHGSHHRVDGAVVHQVQDFKPGHVLTVDGLPTTTPARAVVDLAATGGERYLARVVDHLLVEQRTTTAALARCFGDVLRPGKPGMAKLARVLDSRGPGDRPAQSYLEERLFAALDAAGLPAPERQLPLPGEVGGFADGGYRDAQLLLEADGRRWHTRVDDFGRDRQRDAATATAGWLTLRFSYEELVGDPEGVAATVAQVREVRLAQLRAAEASADRNGLPVPQPARRVAIASPLDAA